MLLDKTDLQLQTMSGSNYADSMIEVTMAILHPISNIIMYLVNLQGNMIGTTYECNSQWSLRVQTYSQPYKTSYENTSEREPLEKLIDTS